MTAFDTMPQDLLSYLYRTVEKRLEPDLNTGCHLWPGATDRCGYGRIRYRYNGDLFGEGAHRIVLAYAKGLPAEGHVAAHSCDTPACCNPEHLSFKTRNENMAEMAAKGRARASDGAKRLTEAERQFLRTTDLPHKAAARVVGCSPKTARYHALFPRPEDEGAD